MRFLIHLLLALAIAALTGLGSVWMIVRDGAGVEMVHRGPWTAWIAAGNPDADPYTKAMLARTGRIPLNTSEAIEFRAARDSSGETLSGQCDYLIHSGEIDSRWWTLTVTDTDDRLIRNVAERYAFDSVNVLRDNDGGFDIRLAPTARSGNWIPTGVKGSLIITLRLYDTAMISNGNIANPDLPEIRRMECSS